VGFNIAVQMKAYSLDLRQKIIQVYENEEVSQRQLAKRFCVALSFIEKLLKQSLFCYFGESKIRKNTHTAIAKVAGEARK
jgi:hypothetical protein